MDGDVDPLIEALLVCRFDQAQALAMERSDPTARGTLAALGGDLRHPDARTLLGYLAGLWRDSTGTNPVIE